MGFSRVLADLRASVGNPSFRTMAGRSKAISHTTLHEAVQGNRLPSWATTAEFVKACDADPRAYRDRWESAYRAVGQTLTATDPDDGAVSGPPALDTGDAPAVIPTSPAPPDSGPGVGAGVGAGVEETPPPAAPRGRRRLLVAVLLLTVAAVGAISGAAWSTMRHKSPTPSSGLPMYQPADCPVQQTNPPTAPPEHEGDRAIFVRDVTLDDCTHVPRGHTVRKVWQLRNGGSVEWRGYTLHRMDPQGRTDCQTIIDVPVPTTAPGQVVDVAVDVITPNGAGFCFVRFKMMDGAGKVAFPGGRPVNFQLIIDA